MNQVVISWCNQAKYIDILENSKFHIKSFSANIWFKWDLKYINQINVRRVIFFPYPCSEDAILRKNRLTYVNTSLFILYAPHVYILKEASSGNTDINCEQCQQISVQL